VTIQPAGVSGWLAYEKYCIVTTNILNKYFLNRLVKNSLSVHIIIIKRNAGREGKKKYQQAIDKGGNPAILLV